MSLTKHASFTVLSAKIAEQGSPRLRAQGHRVEFQYDPKPGFLYVRSRAISSRCNDNFDEFPAEEIKAAYRTFVGKPVFVNHHNADHRRARGVIIDAALHEDVNPDGSPDTWAEVLMEVDAIRFPKLAQAIIAGHIDRTSMGTDVQYSICSFCGNKAASPVDYCAHIPRMKGKRIYRTTASGSKEGILVREICYGLGFFENSLLVEEPADPTAYFLGVDARGIGGEREAVKTASQAPVYSTDSIQVKRGRMTPSDGTGPVTAKTAAKIALLPGEVPVEVVAPADVNTLRDAKCPVCSEEDSFDGEKCKICGFIRPPDEFGDPDTARAQENDLRQHTDDVTGANGGTLRCTNCGHTFNDGAAPKTAVVLDAGGDSADATVPQITSNAGDTCPDCGEGVLEQVQDNAEQAEVNQEFAPAGQAVTKAEVGTAGFAPAGSATASKTPRVARRGGSQKEESMRPALAAPADQQKQIEAQGRAIERIAALAGLQDDPIIRVATRKQAVDENPAFGGPITDGTEEAPEAPAVTTQEAATPTAKDDPENIGAAPLTDVTPAATTSVDSTGTVLDVPLDLNEQDVEAPVAGTDTLGKGEAGEQGTNRVETEVRVAEPTTQKAFDDGGFLSTGSAERLLASLRLARLQIQAGLATGNDLDLAQVIASNTQESDHDIQTKIATLSQVVSSRPAPQAQPARPAPQHVAAARAVPSLAGGFQAPQIAVTASVTDDEVAFE